MKKTYDVLIIGGGVNGCSIAYQMSKRGYQAAVLEKTRVGAEASSAAAGMLGAQVEIKENGPFFDFARKSRDMFSQLVPELEETSGVPVSYVRNGMLKVAQTDTEVNHLLDMLAFQKKAGERAEWRDPNVISVQEPNIKGDIKGALYIPGDGQVKAKELTQAYARGANLLGADIYEFTPVTGLLEEKGRVNGVTTPSGRFYAEHVVLAGGVSSDLIPTAKANIPSMIPVKGECVSVKPAKPVMTATIHASDFYLVPKPGGNIIIGATEQEGRMDKPVSARAVQELLSKAIRLVPDLQDAEWVEAWSGVRPQTIDGMPYLGAASIKGLWMAAGHYRNGILLSALTGEWMADLIEGTADNEEWIRAFAPLRLKDGKENLVETNH
ncbi:glycine oxidase ThiO [Alteribacillus sp. YIM 98480]|uniref:glycine oxidase ThiO n=1 Tax=Alteribacillus sp. YIM 98480 TaxID=2606599 RepID=UPI00131AFC3F|nr:glycine oxidase ThiO [Alteribacillus sp. YIM 98480]